MFERGGKIAALIVVSLLALLTTGLIRAEPAAEVVCMDAETRDLTRGIVIDGFSLALKTHAQHLFEIWQRDGQDEPQRAMAGLRNGISAFTRARQSMLRWNPPPCKGDRQ